MQRVLVVRIGRLGDTILATPVIEALHQVYGSRCSDRFCQQSGCPGFYP